jgi:selenocysteine-specific elongation factor
VLRSYSPVVTIGGGVVLDPAPTPGRPRWPEGVADPAPVPRLRALVTRRPLGLELQSLPVVLGTPPRQTPRLIRESGMEATAGHLVSIEAVTGAEELALVQVAEYHRAHQAENGMPLETLRQVLSRRGAAGALAVERLVAGGRLVLEGGQVREPRFRPRTTGGEALVERIVELVEQAGLTPPAAAELEAEVKVAGVMDALRLAARTGRLEAVERDRYFGASALAGFRETVARVGARGPITPQALREETGLSRKFLIPLLEWADRTGLTVRSGEARVLVRARKTPAGGT